MKGIYGKQKFFIYYSYDAHARSHTNVASIDPYSRFITWNNKVMSKLLEPTGKSMFRLRDTFERFDQYIINRRKKK